MKNFNLKKRIILDLESLISESCPEQKCSSKYEDLHVALVKKHYNATDVSIDYHRRRIQMDIVMDDRSYNPKTVNTYLPTIRANFWFRNLSDFLKSCLDKDNRSLAFYASILKTYRKNNSVFAA